MLHYQPNKHESRNGERKCRNVACGSIISKHQKEFTTGYCTEWCKELGGYQLRDKVYKEKKRIKEIKLLEFLKLKKT